MEKTRKSNQKLYSDYEARANDAIKKLMSLYETEDNPYKCHMMMEIASFISQQSTLIKRLIEENECKLV